MYIPLTTVRGVVKMLLAWDADDPHTRAPSPRRYATNSSMRSPSLPNIYRTTSMVSRVLPRQVYTGLSLLVLLLRWVDALFEQISRHFWLKEGDVPGTLYVMSIVGSMACVWAGVT